MFGKKQKNEFGDKNYKMKDAYEADKLIVGNFQRISGGYMGGDGPIVETTEQKYIFESIQEGKKTRYREIFTGFVTDNIDDTSKDGINCKYFDLPYLYEPEKFTDYFPQTKGLSLPKLSLIWIQNDINYRKEKSKKKIISSN